VKLSVSVMAHPMRGREVIDLQYALGRRVPISWDTEGPASGNADRVWRNARDAWMMHDPDADWHLLLQDDAVPARDLLAGLERGLDSLPEPGVVSLYLGQGRLVPLRWGRLATMADSAGALWVRTNKLMWGVAIALPTAWILDMIAYADTKARVPDDMRVAGWAERFGLDVWYTWPSLVDHLMIESLTKHKMSDRRARRYYQGSCLDIPWGGPIVTDPLLARKRGARSGPRGTRTVRSGRP
jgi:hypothetical protein